MKIIQLTGRGGDYKILRSNIYFGSFFSIYAVWDKKINLPFRKIQISKYIYLRKICEDFCSANRGLPEGFAKILIIIIFTCFILYFLINPLIVPIDKNKIIIDLSHYYNTHQGNDL